MKLLAVGVALLSGGAAASQSEVATEVATNTYEQVKEMVQQRFGQNLVETVKETGFPYPSAEFLSTLTEDQAFAITSAIDVINAQYDWANMTDEEIAVALTDVKAEMQTLYADLGINAPMIQTRTRTGYSEDHGKHQGLSNRGTQEPRGAQDGSCEFTPVVEAPDGV